MEMTMVIMVRMMTPTQTAREAEMRTKTPVGQGRMTKAQLGHFVKCGASDTPTLIGLKMAFVSKAGRHGSQMNRRAAQSFMENSKENISYVAE